MKSNVIRNKKNMLGSIGDIFKSVGGALKSLWSTKPDEIQEEDVSTDIKAQVASVEGTTFDNSDYVEVPAGKSVKFGGISSYRRNVDVSQVVRAHENGIRSNQEKTNKGQEKGAARTRGAR